MRETLIIKVEVINDVHEVNGSVFVAKIKNIEGIQGLSSNFKTLSEILEYLKKSKFVRVNLKARTLTIYKQDMLKSKLGPQS